MDLLVKYEKKIRNHFGFDPQANQTQYNKHITIVNDNSDGDVRVVIYDRHIFIVQATDLLFINYRDNYFPQLGNKILLVFVTHALGIFNE